MWIWLKRGLAPPTFEEEETTRVAALLNTTLWAVIGLTLIVSLSLQIAAPELRPGRVGLTIFALVGGLQLLMRRGQVKLASFFFCLALWGLSSVDVLVLGGETTVAGTAYSLVTLLAGLLLGGRAGIGFAGVSVLFWLGTLYFPADVVIFGEQGLPEAFVRILQSTHLMFLAILLHLAISSMNRALARAHRNELDLQAEVAERKRTELIMERYAARLARSNRELEDFAYVASHDLQEPLRKIQTFGDRLQSKYGELLPEQGQNYVARMQQAAARMRTLIEGLLAYSRVTSQTQPFQPVDLAQTIRNVLSDLEIRLDQVKGRVTIGTLPSLEGDPIQMRQLFQNLIGNALKFHRPEVSPEIKIEAWEPGQVPSVAGLSEPVPAEHWQITIADNGIGFDEKYSEQIFQVFQRLHNRTEYEGTGVGLATCRKIVERHGGTIIARSTPGVGTTFILTFPQKQTTGDEI